MATFTKSKTSVQWAKLTDNLGQRVAVYLRKCAGHWRWFDENGEDTEVSGRTKAEAIKAARTAWAGERWNFVLTA